jgi:Carboxypeptidase regulatory-like domain
MKSTNRIAFSILGSLIFLMNGCGGGDTQTVEGIVTLDGAPVEKATVTLLPTKDRGQAGSALTDESGKFRIHCAGTPNGGLPAGEYKVTVVKSDSMALSMDEIKGMDPKDAMAKMFGGKIPVGGGKVGGKGLPKMATMLPGKYSKAESTPLSVTVPMSGKLSIAIDSTKP